MSGQADPRSGEVRSRVEAFIADYHPAWSRAGSVPLLPFDPFAPGGPDTAAVEAWVQQSAAAVPDFAAWAAEVAALESRHFVPGARSGLDGALSGKPHHDPTAERVVDVAVRRTRAEVRTVLPDGLQEHHHTFRLALVQGDWRIERIIRTLEAPATPVLAEAEVRRLAAEVGGPPAGPPLPEELAHGTTALFDERFEVERLGTLRTHGLLTVHDLGWVQHDLAPLGWRVPAGSYPVEVSRDAEGMNVAVRLRLADAAVASRVPAVRGGGRSQVDVDAGNVALADFEDLARTSVVDVEDAYGDRIGSDAVFAMPGSGAEVAVLTSGYGDGSYPVTWGLAADGSPVDLVVDLLVAVEEVTADLEVPYRAGAVDDPVLAAHGFEVTPEGFAHREQVGDEHVRSVAVVDAEGRPVDGSSGGSLHTQGRVQRRWVPAGDVPAGARVVVTVYQGYRHV